MAKQKTCIALEANYAVTRDGRTSHVGKRAVLRLRDLLAQVDVDALSNAVPKNARLVFWVTRSSDSDGYTLVSVGQAVEPLIALRLDAPDALAPLVASGERRSLTQQDELREPLGGPDSRAEDVTLWVEAPGGDRWRMPIEFIGHVDTVAKAKSHFADVVLAVLAYGQSYRALLYVPPDGYPIPTMEDICRALRQCGDAKAQVVANALGCPSL